MKIKITNGKSKFYFIILYLCKRKFPGRKKKFIKCTNVLYTVLFALLENCPIIIIARFLSLLIIITIYIII